MNELQDMSKASRIAVKSEIIAISSKAVAHIKKIFTETAPDKNYLRVGVVGGGCSGLSYKIDFDEKREGDNLIPLGDDIQVLIDPKSTIYLKGVTLDFEDGLTGKGLIFVNPNASNTCGCGESFAV